MELLSDVANASAQSGESEYLLAKRLHRILSSPRGEGRTIKEDFYMLANLCEDGLLTHLEQEYSDLTRNEIGLCGMITLGLEPACISTILGYDHENTFYNKRAEIRKKLHLEHSVSLEGFLFQKAEGLRRHHEEMLRQLKERY